MKNIIIFSIIVIFLFPNCKKESSSQKIIGSIEIEDANALIYCSVQVDPYSGKDISDTLKLMMLTTANEVHPVVIKSDEDKEFVNEYITDGIYNLTAEKFLFNVYHKGDESRVIESYIVNKQDGKAIKLLNAILPARYNGTSWVKGSASKGFAYASNYQIYIPDGSKLIKLEISGDDVSLNGNISLTTYNYDVDTLGNVLMGNMLIYNDNTRENISDIKDNDCVVKRSGAGFFIVSVESDTLRIKTLDIIGKSYTLNFYAKLQVNTANWKFIGNAYINNFYGSCLIFDKAILYINSDTAKLVSFQAFSLSNIINYYISNDALYINGKNTLNKEVFQKIRPQNNPVVYTDVFAPDIYYYKYIQVSMDGGLSFYAKKVYASKEAIGYRSANQTTMVLDNDYGIKIKQVLTLK
jgi:hypothetical protein